MPSTKDRRTASSNYRKPPVAHQFKKGTSGNPNGRPRKKAVQPGFGALGGGITDRLGSMALDEAIRPVTVREGDKVSEIPAMQALIRTMFRAAAQGDTKAGRQLLEVIARAESGRTGAALEILEHAVQYKEKYVPIFEQHEREGLDPLDIFPQSTLLQCTKLIRVSVSRHSVQICPLGTRGIDASRKAIYLSVYNRPMGRRSEGFGRRQQRRPL